MLKAKVKIQNGRYTETHDITLDIHEDRIYFSKSPYAMKDEIKAMRSPKWHGFNKENPRKVWSVENCARNVFQLKALMGEDVYAWWDRPLIDTPEFERPLAAQQVEMVRRILTYHYFILGAEMGLGKTLAAIEAMERSGKKNWWYVCPASAQVAATLEFEKWGLDPSININMMSFEKLVNEVRYGWDNIVCPDGIIIDESDRAKTPVTHIAKASQAMADLIREVHGFEGYVVEMSGTTQAKNPSDIWSQAEIAWPGFLREGSIQAFEKRYAIMEDSYTNEQGVTFQKQAGWKEEELEQLPSRLTGLMEVYRKNDWLDLPKKEYQTIELEPSPKVQRVARMLCKVAPNTITALTWCRALSSGFQYVTKQVGEETCKVCLGTGKYSTPTPEVCPGCSGCGVMPKFDRQTVKVETPKDAALRGILTEEEDRGRIVVSASFQGSIDRCVQICQEEGWNTIKVDSRGWEAYDSNGERIGELKGRIEIMHFWEECEGRLAFVCNPGSAKYGLTLTLAQTLVFFDNDFSAVNRLQMEDRIHRMGMGDSARIIDLIHLRSDRRVVEVLRANREAELKSLGALQEYMDYTDDEDLEFEEILLDTIE